MNQKSYETRIFRMDEFMTLSAISGLEEVRGIFAEGEEEPSAEQLYYTVFSLVRKGMLKDVKTLQEPFRGIFADIRDAETYIEVKNSNPEYGDLAIYVHGGDSLAASVSVEDKDALSVTILPTEDLLTYLAENDYLPADYSMKLGVPRQENLSHDSQDDQLRKGQERIRNKDQWNQTFGLAQGASRPVNEDWVNPEDLLKPSFLMTELSFWKKNPDRIRTRWTWARRKMADYLVRDDGNGNQEIYDEEAGYTDRMTQDILDAGTAK